MIASIACYTLGCLGALAIGYVAGKSYGYSKGEAFGWQEGYFGRIADDKSRRNKDGTFKARA